MSGKRRIVPVLVDDERATEVVAFLQNSHGYALYGSQVKAPVPPDDQATRDLQEAIEIVEMSGWSHRHELTARLRAWAGMEGNE